MLVGSLPLDRLAARAVPLAAEAPAAAVFDAADVVYAAWELAGVDRTVLFPPALHPTSPTLLTLTGAVATGGGLGLLRLSCRHGARARALLVGAVAWGSGTAVAEAFGCGADDGEIVVEGRTLQVRSAGGPDVTVALGPGADGERVLGPHDVQYVTGLHPVVLPERGVRLLQVEVHADTGPATALRPDVEAFVWPGLPAGVAPVHPVGATLAHGRLELPRPRFVARPDVLAHLGSEPLSA